MATYEYRCRACSTTFEQRRAMDDADAPATCPSGHADTTRLLSAFASTRGPSPTASAPSMSMGGGGCCGGGCGRG